MQTYARADRETGIVSAHKTSSQQPAAVENIGAAAGRNPVTSSRRSFLMNSIVNAAAIATATVVVAPSIAADHGAAPSSSVSGDIKLRGLMKRLRSACRHVAEAQRQCDEAQERAMALSADLPAIPPEPQPPAEYVDLWRRITVAEMNMLPADHPLVQWKKESESDYDRYFSLRRERHDWLNEHSGALAAQDVFDRAWEAAQEIGGEVYATQADTIGGLCAKVRALSLLGLCDDGEGDAWWLSIRKDIMTLGEHSARGEMHRS